MNTNALIALTLTLSAAFVTLVNAPRIQAWEKANNYPFGQMCHSVFTFNVDTCAK